jgi:hypothetical protein
MKMSTPKQVSEHGMKQTQMWHMHGYLPLTRILASPFKQASFKLHIKCASDGVILAPKQQN